MLEPLIDFAIFGWKKTVDGLKELRPLLFGRFAEDFDVMYYTTIVITLLLFLCLELFLIPNHARTTP